MKLTIFTPSYNRAALLPRLYGSLLQQTLGGFEWLIVDDGSTDDTPSVVNAIISEGRIPVRYIKKENGGKHTAHNRAVEQAQGKWFFCVDSDDRLASDAVSHILSAIETAEPKTAGFVGYKTDQTGRSLCAALPKDGPRYGLYSLVRRGGGKGEYALLFRTDILKQYPFPEIAGERFVTECVLYDRLELEGYTVCPLDAVLEICEYQPDGLSSSAYRLLLQNPTGYQIYHAQRIDLAVSFGERLRHCICYQAFRRMSRNRDFLYRGRHKWVTALTWLSGAAAERYYRVKGKGNV